MHELLRELCSHSNTWQGHIRFARWLAKRWPAPRIIDLGVDYGLSTFSFALANENASVIGIDCFDGDPQSGFRDTEAFVNDFKDRYNIHNVKFIKGYFDEVVKRPWMKDSYQSQDVIHIDGLHTYEAIKNDFNTWLPYLKPSGVIIMHDTRAYKPGFGVDEFFSEIDLPKLNFEQSYGLGVVSRDADLIEEIYDEFGSDIDYLYFPGAR